VLLFAGIQAQNIRGIYYWTWSSGINVTGLNAGVAFSGWVDADQALSDSSAVYNRLPGTKYLSLGGGNANGRWSAAPLQKIASYCQNGRFNAYPGVVFDIEEGDSGLGNAFAAAFAACKNHGHQVLVTISHSAPYGISDGKDLMRRFFQDRNIDILSPQLYTTGTEPGNDYSTDGFDWSNYVGAIPSFVPSIVRGSYFADARNYFSQRGITADGYVQWSQN